MATLYLRNGNYYINYNINGKRVRKSVGKDQRQAELFLKEYDYKLSKGIIKPDNPEIPINTFFDKYLENCKQRLAKGTYIRYRNSIKHFRKFFIYHHPVKYIHQIGRGAFQEYIIYRQESKPKSNTINVELTSIRAALNWAVDNEWLEKSPANQLKLLKSNDSKSGYIITEDEINALLRGCMTLKNGSWFKDILLILLNTGMRRGELVNLLWDDIDWTQNIIKIQPKPFWNPKSYSRDIPINSIVRQALERFKERNNCKFIISKNGKKIEDNILRKKLVTLSKRIGLPHITRIHDLRHTFASNLLMKGVDIPTVQALLGHKSWSTTLIYSHQTKEHVRKAIAVIEAQDG